MALPVLATRMHRWDVSCFRIMNLKLSALCPFVPRSSAKGGSHPSGGTMHAIPALQRTKQVSHTPEYLHLSQLDFDVRPSYLLSMSICKLGMLSAGSLSHRATEEE